MHRPITAFAIWTLNLSMETAKSTDTKWKLQLDCTGSQTSCDFSQICKAPLPDAFLMITLKTHPYLEDGSTFSLSHVTRKRSIGWMQTKKIEINLWPVFLLRINILHILKNVYHSIHYNTMFIWLLVCLLGRWNLSKRGILLKGNLALICSIALRDRKSVV